MTVAELLRDEELRQREFPVTRHKIYLAHAGVCPLPRRVAEAIKLFSEECTGDDQEAAWAYEAFLETRTLAARLIGAQPNEISFVGPTSLGLSMVASGWPLRRRENILVYFDDYPSNVYPWMALAEKGVEVRFINVRELGRIRPLDIEGQVDEQTRLVALASCHFLSGYRLELTEIGKLLRARNILFCVDGIQTLGLFPTSAADFDFLAADAHKWLLGPCAAGLLFVRQKLQEHLRPPIYGWHNVRCPNYVAQEQLVYPPDGRRFEAGSANLLGLAGLRAALSLLLELGIDQIAAEALRKRRWIVASLQEKGYTVLHADVPSQNAGGIITFYREGVDLPALQQKLADAQVVLSLRADRSGRKYLRISPHFYNTDEEIQRALKML